MNYNRREFIKAASILSGSLLLLPACSRPIKRYRVFTEQEANCLIAMCEQIVPADEYLGAAEAGVIYYIDKQTDLRFPNERELFCNGVASLQAWCKENHNQLFETLALGTQNEILQSMERNEINSDIWTVSPKQFFDTLLMRTMQGFYGPPRHGGNKNYASFRMMRLDYPQLVGQNRYRA